jgi:TRAP transporter 4TM/12TM fusion protein
MSLTKSINEEEFNKGEETGKRLGKFWTILLSVLGVSLAVFHIYTAFQGSSIMQTSIHFLFALTIAFIIYPASKKSRSGKLGLPVIDIIGVLLAILINGYYLYHFDRIFLELGYLSPTTADLVLATVTLVLIFEAARRAIGIAFPILAVIALIYALFGQYFPVMFRHGGNDWSTVAIEMYIGQLGIFQGTLLSVSANTVAIFIIFGAILLVTGGGAMFIKLAIAIAGRMTGGPAKVSTIASGLFGSISGSTAANTATTGVFTIPLMKNNGYKNHFAGGVESAASCGGQILPPVMGAAAFVLAEVTQINYVVVAASAIIPAVLFYTGVWISVHLEAKRTGLKPVKEENMYRLRDVVFTMQFLTLFVPFVVLITFLMMNFTPVISAFWAIISSLVLFSIQTVMERDFKNGLKKLVEAGTEGAKTITMIAVILAVAQIIATVIGMTGVGGRLSGLIASIGSTSILLTLALGMVVTIILGMGVPTIAAYMLSASVVASAFATIGLPTLGSHLFILYYAILSGITPPVALAAYVAGGIANAHWFRTAIAACKVGLSGFLIPFMFIYNDALLGHGSFGEVTFAVVTAVLGITALAGSTIGYMFTHVNWFGRMLFLTAALLLLTPELMFNGIGFVVFLILMLTQWKNRPPKNKVLSDDAEEENDNMTTDSKAVKA